jgi:hypothetical protein
MGRRSQRCDHATANIDTDTGRSNCRMRRNSNRYCCCCSSHTHPPPQLPPPRQPLRRPMDRTVLGNRRLGDQGNPDAPRLDDQQSGDLQSGGPGEHRPRNVLRRGNVRHACHHHGTRLRETPRHAFHRRLGSRLLLDAPARHQGLRMRR